MTISEPAAAGPLAGIRVLDFGRFIAGPYCGALLSDMGANVIRIDRRQGSEDRYTGPVTDGGGFPFFQPQQTQPYPRHGETRIWRHHSPAGCLCGCRNRQPSRRRTTQDGA